MILLTIKDIYFDNNWNLIVSFENGYYMKFVAKMSQTIIRNVYYNATGDYYNNESLDVVKYRIVGKQVYGISSDNSKRINQTRPMNQTENQKYRDSDTWKELKCKVAELRNHTCEVCNYHFNDLSYEIHHKDYYKDHNIEYTDTNPIHYQLLCRRCHQDIHNQLSNTINSSKVQIINSLSIV